MRDRECLDKLLQRADDLSDAELTAINAMAMKLYRKQQLSRHERKLSRTLAVRLDLMPLPDDIWNSNPHAAPKPEKQAPARTTPEVLKRLPLKPPSRTGMAYRERSEP